MLQINPVEFLTSLAVDLAVVYVLAFLLFYRRHKDREMAIAIAAINITLWALTGALASYTLSLGVGFALFAVISVIRLRSTTASWISMAYLLVGLGSGLIIGLSGYNLMFKIEYAVFLVLVMALVDSKYFLRRGNTSALLSHKTRVTLEGSNIDPDLLSQRAATLLGVEVTAIKVLSVNENPGQVKLEATYRKLNG